MINKFSDEYKILSIILTITFISILLGTSINLALYFCVYFVNYFVLPIKLKDDNTVLFRKIIITIVIFAISVLTITYFNGIGKSLYSYMVVFTIIIIYCIVLNLLKKRIKI